MIVVTTLKGERLAINDELIERVEDDHPTRVILTSGTCYMVAESVEEIVRRCQQDRAEVQAIAFRHVGHADQMPSHEVFTDSSGTANGRGRDPDLNIVRLSRRTTPTDGSR